MGLTIKALNPLFIGLPKWWMIGTKNAAVLPDPVGAHANICLFYEFIKTLKYVQQLYNSLTCL